MSVCGEVSDTLLPRLMRQVHACMQRKSLFVQIILGSIW